jgi:hypothetical protein
LCKERAEKIPALISGCYSSKYRTIHTILSKLRQAGSLLDIKEWNQSTTYGRDNG